MNILHSLCCSCTC